MRPDLVWYGPGSVATTAVVDEIQGREAERVPNPDLYQMLVYCTVGGLALGHLI